MITPSFGLTATERVLPRLALDWTTGIAQSGVDVTRAGVATFVGSNGLIQSATADTQRIDYSSGTAGLLVEEQRTNLLTYSEDFATGGSPVDATVDSDAAVAPDGTSTMDKIVEDSGAGITPYWGRGFSWSTSTTYTYSVFLKKAGRNRAIFWGRASSSTLPAVIWNLDSGEVDETNGCTATIKHFKDGIYRCTVTFSTGVGIFSNTFRIGPTSDSTTIASSSYEGDGVSGVYIWGHQLEAGAFATSYIPTESTAVTRNADVATMTGTNFDWFNPTEGTFVAQFIPQNVSTVTGIVSASDGTTNNQLYVARDTTASTFSIRTGGASQGFLVNGTLVAGAVNKVCGGYKLNDFGLSANAVAISVDTAGTVPTVNRLTIGSSSSGATAYLNGHMQKVSFYLQKLTSAEIQAFAK